MTTLLFEFSRFVAKGVECWHWTGAKDKDGYGVFNYAHKTHRAPRVALELDGRPVPIGKYACHHCDNPACVRPDHLYIGTPTENARDTKRRGRLNPGRKAKLSPADIKEIRSAIATHTAIAARFGVSRSNVTLIRNRKTWASIP